MDSKKSQAINFAYEVVPVMFHSQTTDFITYIKRDGLKFLEFWWNYIGEQLEKGQECTFEGMDYKLVDLDGKNTMIIVTMPQPRDPGEALYLILVAKPERRFAWVRLPSTHVLALISRPTEDDPLATELGEITPRGIYVRIRKGPVPNIQTMTNIGMELVKPHPAQ
jgi:hypothetical protein